MNLIFDVFFGTRNWFLMIPGIIEDQQLLVYILVTVGDPLKEHSKESILVNDKGLN